MKKSYLLYCLSLSSLSLTFSGCSSDSDGGDTFGTDTPRYDITFSDTKAATELKTATQDFSLNFFKTIAKENAELNSDGNFCVSPFSAAVCLGIALNGAAGSTYTEMQNTLGYAGMTDEQINAYIKTILTEFPKLDGRTDLAIANSMWAKSGCSFLDNFVSVNQSNYDAELQDNQPFDATTLNKINSWCSDKTKKLIPKILEQIPGDVQVYLLNAVYFKGMWKSRFNESDTKDKPFYTADGTALSVKTMYQQGNFGCYIDDKMSVVELPYGNEAFSLVLFMPRDKTVDETIAGLTSAEWGKWKSAMDTHVATMYLYLPRFTQPNTAYNLIPTLESMGIKSAFAQNADFTRMCKNNLGISQVNHRTYMKVDESGTEAAATTVIAMGYTSAGSSVTMSIPEVKFDHPFGFILKEKSTGTILFVGKVEKPE